MNRIFEQKIKMKFSEFVNSNKHLLKSLWSGERGKAGGHKPQHFPLPCHILTFFSSGGSHEPQPYGIPCPSI